MYALPIIRLVMKGLAESHERLLFLILSPKSIARRKPHTSVYMKIEKYNPMYFSIIIRSHLDRRQGSKIQSNLNPKSW